MIDNTTSPSKQMSKVALDPASVYEAVGGDANGGPEAFACFSLGLVCRFTARSISR
jgi:hypothetical protein